jgi:putative transposase
MRVHLRRYYGHGDLHFITFSCYRREPRLASPAARDCFLSIFEQVRRKYDFVVVGYVVMPEHVHLLISEPATSDPSLVMQVLKQRTSRILSGQAPRFWQLRFHDFNVFNGLMWSEKLRYMHWNPVRRGLVTQPEAWRWSSYRHYAFQEHGIVTINQGWKPLPSITRSTCEQPALSPLRKERPPSFVSIPEDRNQS